MRDKVKRFLSILMTALMLVNLLPVGALAEGVKISNSVQSKVSLTADSGTAPIETGHVYVYVKIDGASPETLAKFKLNSSGWYTIGSIAKTMPGKGEWEPYWYGGGEWVITPTPSDTKTYQPGEYAGTDVLPPYSIVGLKPWEDNKLIPLGNVRWTGYKLTTGANNYQPESIFSWHMDGIVNFKDINVPYTVKHVVKKSSPEIVLKEETKNQKYGQWTEAQALTFEGYKQVGEIKNKKIGDDPITIYVYYEPDKKQTVDVTYRTSEGGTITNGGTYKIQPVTGNLSGGGRLPIPIPTAADGYEFAGWERDDGQTYNDLNDVYSKLNQKTADAGTYTLYQNTTFTAKFEKKANLSYTVNYYWNGTEYSVKPSKTVTGKMFGEEVTESPIGADGYTPVSNDPKKITIGTDNNEITFYYYKNVTLTANSKTETYDGTQKSVSGFTGAPTEADFSAIEVGAKGTNAGTYDAIFPTGTKGTVDATKKYIVTEATDGWLKIDPVETEVVVKITGNTKTETYNGKEHNVEGYTVTSISNPLYTANDFTFTGTAEAKGTNAGTYQMGLKAEQFANTNGNFKKVTFVVNDGKLTINPVDEVVVTITGHNDTVPYDGDEHTVTGYDVSIDNELYKESDFTFTGTAEAKGTNAGTYQMGLKADQFTNNKSKNFSKVTFEVADGWLKINPIDKVTVTITGRTLETTYDGKEHDVFGYDATPSNALYRPNEDIQFNGTDYNKIAKGTDAGTYPMGLEVSYFTNISDNFTNVEFIVTDGYVKINPRPVMLTSANLIKVYDGTPLTNGDAPVKEEFGTEKAFPEGEGVTYTFTRGQTNAGSSKNMFTYAWNEGTNKDNYTIYQIEGDLVVTPIDGIKVTITGHKDTQTYDGKPHKVEGYDVKPDNLLFTEKDIKFNGEAEATGTDAQINPYQMGLKPEQFTNTSNNFTNVEFVVEDGQIVITPRAVTLTSETAGKTYDGTALEKPVVTVGGDGFVEGQVKEIKATGSVTNAGSAANTITFTPNKETFKDGNYAITKTEGTLTIAKRSVLITSQSATKTYDGSALTRPAVTITGDGFVPGELAKAEATGSITKVGSTPNAIQYTTTGAFNAANYSIALSVGTLTVTEKPKPEPRRTFNLTINYVYQNGKRAAASYNRGGLKNGETFDITSPVIAGYTASETVVSGTIYNRDIKVTVIYTADGVNLDDYGVPLGLGNITMNVGDCFE